MILCTNRFLFFAPIVFFFLVLEKTKTFSPSPRSLVTLHFFTLYPTLHLPDFLQPACFSACLLLFVREPLSLRNCQCQFVRVSWTEGVLCSSVCYSSKREGRQVSKHKALSTIHETRNKHWALERNLARFEPPGLVCPSPFYPPTSFPVVVETINPTAFSPLSCGSCAYHPRLGHRVRPWTLRSPTSLVVDTKQSNNNTR